MTNEGDENGNGHRRSTECSSPCAADAPPHDTPARERCKKARQQCNGGCQNILRQRRMLWKQPPASYGALPGRAENGLARRPLLPKLSWDTFSEACQPNEFAAQLPAAICCVTRPTPRRAAGLLQQRVRHH